LPATILWLVRVRFLWITLPDRIGHLAIEPDIYLKQKRLGFLPFHFGILVAPAERVANKVLLDLWSNVIPTLTHALMVRVALAFWRFRYLWIDFTPYVDSEIDQPATCYKVLTAWGRREPLLKLPAHIVARGDGVLAELGVSRDDWIVCLHVREAGYAQQDDHLHEFRNCNPSNFLPAVQEIVGRGGWCIRMGGPETRRLPQMERVIDYAHSAVRSDWMDIYLCCRSRIFLGTSSGLMMVPTIFGGICGTTNFVPISRPPLNLKGLGIPKLLRRTESGRLLTFPNMVEREPARSFGEDAGIPGVEVVENSPDEIRDMVCELLDECEGKRILDSSDLDRQRRFLSIYPAQHYASEAQARISPAFLRRYEHLLPPKAA
jgi:putative glycosyltransferase (TIGR04372 family)